MNAAVGTMTMTKLLLHFDGMASFLDLNCLRTTDPLGTITAFVCCLFAISMSASLSNSFRTRETVLESSCD